MLNRFLLIAFAFTLLSCQAGGKLRVKDVQDIPHNEVIVFGHIKIILGDNYDWRNYLFTKIFVLDEETSKTWSIPLGSDGILYWHLPPGKYVISDWYISTSGQKGRLWAKFQVEGKKQATYIGTLILIFESAWRNRYRTKIEDNYDEALKSFKDEFPEFDGEVDKNLMTLEKL